MRGSTVTRCVVLLSHIDIAMSSIPDEYSCANPVGESILYCNPSRRECFT